MPLNLSALNVLPAAEFVRVAGPLFEHSPWIAERAASARPFATLVAMHNALVSAVAAATEAEQVGLIAAHPDLAGKLAVSGLLTAESTAEQKTACLDRLSPADFARITALNDAYRAKFGFPFVICVRDHTQAGIFEAFEQRVANPRDAEIKTALAQIARIAWHRLQDLVTAA
jgi:2-oxo-4-hydroxy-4-carboxy-5-ureidoimidazoline decarboxylase